MTIKAIIPVLACGGLLVSCVVPVAPPLLIVEEHNVTVHKPKTPPKPKPVPRAEDFRAVTTSD